MAMKQPKIHSLGHSFGAELVCGGCGQTWHKHQGDPLPCVADHQRAMRRARHASIEARSAQARANRLAKSRGSASTDGTTGGASRNNGQACVGMDPEDILSPRPATAQPPSPPKEVETC